MGSWKVRLPLYAMGLATGGAYSVLFSGGALAYLLGAALVALLVGSAGAYRFILIFPATALYVLLSIYGRPPLSLEGWRKLIEKIGHDVYEAVGIAYTNHIPYDTHPGFLVTLVPTIIVVITFATSATLYEESPVVSVAVLGLTIGVLATVSFEIGIWPFFALFLVSGIALLLLAPNNSQRRGDALKPEAVLAGVLVVCVALALPWLPLAKEAIRPALIDWTKLELGDTSRLTVDADVGNYLAKGRNTELMRIKSPEALLWRGGTLDYFDGSRWSSTIKSSEEEDDGEEISASVPTRELRQSVEVLQAQTNLLFGAYEISGVSAPQAQGHSDGSWTSKRPLIEGTSYQVLSEIPQPSTAQLEAASTAYPESIKKKFLQLPADRPKILGETAQKIQGNYAPNTPYEAARAIEQYLIEDGGFTYSLNTDYSQTNKALERFLGESKRGFCTQFATSMALLAREMGIPSRVVYGAVSGQKVAPKEYLVTGADMHTWVEIYFPGVGWYPFDPTPGFEVPQAMEANAPRPEQLSSVETNASVENLLLQRQQQPGPALETQKTGATDEAVGSAGGEKNLATEHYKYVLLPIFLLGLVAVVPLSKRLLAARGRAVDLYRDLVGRLGDVLMFSGVRASEGDSAALTPTERLVLLAGAAGVEEGAFREFGRAYTERVYALEPEMDVAAAYRKAVGEYEKLPWWKRALGALNPASLLLRGREALEVWWARLGKTLRRRKW